MNPTKNTILILIGLILLALSFTGCAKRIADPQFSLAEGWTYAEAGPEETPEQARTKNYQPLDFSLPTSYSEATWFWYRKTFTIPADLSGKTLSLVLGKPHMAARIYLNGHFVGEGGSFPPETFSEWNSCMDLSASSGYFREGENEILVHYYAFGGNPLTGEKFLSTAREVKSFITRQRFILNDSNAWISFLLLIMAIYHLYIFLRRRKDQENLWYALLSFAFSVYLLNFYITKTPFGESWKGHYLAFQKLIYGTQPVIAYAIYKFIQSFMGFKDYRWFRILAPVSCVIGFIILVTPPNYAAFYATNALGQLSFALPVLIYIPAAFIRGARQKKKETLLLALGLTPLLLTILSDLILDTVISNYIYLSGYGFPLFLLTVLFILGGRFVRDRNAADNLTEHLEEKVQAQTGKMRGLINRVADTAEDVFQDVQVMTETIEQAEKSAESLRASAETVLSSIGNQKESLTQGVEDIGHIQNEMEQIDGIAKNYYEVFEELDNSFRERMKYLQKMESSSGELRSKIDTVSTSAKAGRQTLSNMQKSMAQINQSISQINTVTHVIKDISEQTNVLAINASIEASHAGDRGSGFAVVAGEVRTLAGEVQRNAEQSEAIVKTVLKQVLETGAFTNKAVDELESIMRHFMETQTFYQELEGMLKDEFTSKQTMSTRISDLKNQMEGLLGTISSERQKIAATSRSFKIIDESSGEIDRNTRQQNEDISRLAELINTIFERIKRTHDEVFTLHESLEGFGQEGSQEK